MLKQIEKKIITILPSNIFAIYESDICRFVLCELQDRFSHNMLNLIFTCFVCCCFIIQNPPVLPGEHFSAELVDFVARW